MDSLITLILLALATYRVAYLVAVEDGPGDAAHRLRAWARRRFTVAHEPGVLVEHWIPRGLACPLCVSFWAAPAVIVAWRWLPALVWWLAVAGVVLVAHRWLEERP